MAGLVILALAVVSAAEEFIVRVDPSVKACVPCNSVCALRCPSLELAVGQANHNASSRVVFSGEHTVDSALSLTSEAMAIEGEDDTAVISGGHKTAIFVITSR